MGEHGEAGPAVRLLHQVVHQIVSRLVELRHQALEEPATNNQTLQGIFKQMRSRKVLVRLIPQGKKNKFAGTCTHACRKGPSLQTDLCWDTDKFWAWEQTSGFCRVLWIQDLKRRDRLLKTRGKFLSRLLQVSVPRGSYLTMDSRVCIHSSTLKVCSVLQGGFEIEHWGLQWHKPPGVCLQRKEQETGEGTYFLWKAGLSSDLLLCHVSWSHSEAKPLPKNLKEAHNLGKVEKQLTVYGKQLPWFGVYFAIYRGLLRWLNQYQRTYN